MIVFSDNKTEYDKKVIDDIARKFGLFSETAEILYNRGIRSEEDVEYFLNPGKHHFKDPYLLGGIKDAVERILAAKELEEKYDVEMPIVNAVYSVVRENKKTQEAVDELFRRKQKSELSN